MESETGVYERTSTTCEEEITTDSKDSTRLVKEKKKNKISASRSFSKLKQLLSSKKKKKGNDTNSVDAATVLEKPQGVGKITVDNTSGNINYESDEEMEKIFINKSLKERNWGSFKSSKLEIDIPSYDNPMSFSNEREDLIKNFELNIGKKLLPTVNESVGIGGIVGCNEKGKIETLKGKENRKPPIGFDNNSDCSDSVGRNINNEHKQKSNTVGNLN